MGAPRGAVSRTRFAAPMPTAVTQLQLNFAERAVRRRPVALVLGVLTAVVVFIVGFVANAIAVNALSADIVALASQQQRTLDAAQQLRAEIARLQSADRIGAVARALGLVQPDRPPEPLPVVSR